MYQESVTGSFVFSLTQGAVCIPPDTSDAGWRYPSALWAPMLSAALHAVLRTQRCAAGATAILLQVRTWARPACKWQDGWSGLCSVKKSEL